MDRHPKPWTVTSSRYFGEQHPDGFDVRDARGELVFYGCAKCGTLQGDRATVERAVMAHNDHDNLVASLRELLAITEALPGFGDDRDDLRREAIYHGRSLLLDLESKADGPSGAG